MGVTAAAGPTTGFCDEAVAKNQMLGAFARGMIERRDFCPLFDIVGLDEGTCGRRPAGPGTFQGVSGVVSNLSCSHRSFTYPYVIDFVQSGSLRCLP